jgi:hypothetical protein
MNRVKIHVYTLKKSPIFNTCHSKTNILIMTKKQDKKLNNLPSSV